MSRILILGKKQTRASNLRHHSLGHLFHDRMRQTLSLRTGGWCKLPRQANQVKTRGLAGFAWFVPKILPVPLSKSEAIVRAEQQLVPTTR